MKRLMLLIAVCLSVAAYSQNAENMENGKILVAYYSATGTTERVAGMIASATGGTLLEITPEKIYSSADLNWNNNSSRSSVEMRDASSRPAIVRNIDSVEQYDTIYLGYPIWWNEAPRVVNTFIEAYDLKGKTIEPFATSGGSGISNSVRVLKNTYPDLKWEQGKLLNYPSKDEITDFVGR